MCKRIESKFGMEVVDPFIHHVLRHDSRERNEHINHENRHHHQKHVKSAQIPPPYALRRPWTVVVVTLHAHITASAMVRFPLHPNSTFLAHSCRLRLTHQILTIVNGHRVLVSDDARVAQGYCKVGEACSATDHNRRQRKDPILGGGKNHFDDEEADYDEDNEGGEKAPI